MHRPAKPQANGGLAIAAGRNANGGGMVIEGGDIEGGGGIADDKRHWSRPQVF
jgi:hypothetical protein